MLKVKLNKIFNLLKQIEWYQRTCEKITVTMKLRGYVARFKNCSFKKNAFKILIFLLHYTSLEQKGNMSESDYALDFAIVFVTNSIENNNSE